MPPPISSIEGRRCCEQVVADYDALSRLDPWKTTMLLRVKRRLQGAGPMGGPGAAQAPPVQLEGDDLT